MGSPRKILAYPIQPEADRCGVGSVQRRRRRPGAKKGGQQDHPIWPPNCRRQSLILKIGGKIVVEGSSNYKIHIFDERNPRAPKLYQHSYDCDAIRRISGAQAKMHLGHWEGWVLERI